MGVEYEYIYYINYIVICWINTGVCLQYCCMLTDSIFFMGNLFNVYFNYYILRIIFRGGKNHMNRKSAILTLLIILIVLSTATISTTAIKQRSIRDLSSETLNRQVYLGFANITGNGNSSTLEAVAENFKIGLGSESSYVDFYINYDMNCGETIFDGVGLITLIITIGDQITPTLVTTSTSKNGTLKIENVEVHRQDAVVFLMYVNYTSVIPLYSNSTSAAGAGVFNKGITVVEKSTNPFLCFLEQHPRMFQMLRYLLRV